ncbi:RHS repeat-associated core domain-containing protein [Streptomyces fildesensis]|uniref:RHS repeat-associated core domain-containing protein n=1 Tax=Streptomyces fildesensis TaxID=375757 RepID=A0ABW8CI55_9ACTN
MANRPTDWHVLDLDRDPVPGDPYEVKELARKLGDFADDVSSALRSVKGLSGNNAVQDWAGLAADAYREQFGDLPNELTKLEKSYRLASGALETYWPKLETAQSDADRALAQGRTARQDLDAAKTTQTNANDWVKRAGDKSKEYQGDPKPGVEPPSADEVRTATRNALDASNAQKSANTAVHDAQQRLDAAKELAAQAAHLRDTAASTAEHALHEASDAGIKNKHWWEKAVDWVADHWDEIVAVCKVIVAVLGILVMIIGGPLAWIVLAAALVVLADTLIKYAQGKASLWDVLFAAMDCIPGFKGLTTAGGLLKMAKNLPKLMKGMGSHLGDIAGAMRKGAQGVRQAAKRMGERRCKSDPIDVVTGEMVLPQVDVELPGILPVLLERAHVSSYRAGRWFGPSWASTLDQRLELDGQGICFVADDGMLLQYPVPARDVPVLPVAGPRWPLVWDGSPAGIVTVTDPDTGRTLHFDPNGPTLPTASGQPVQLPLRALSDRNGNRMDIDYSADGVPTGIRHAAYRIGVATSGGHISALYLLGGVREDAPEPDAARQGGDDILLGRFGYDENGHLAEVVNSSGRAARFGYDSHGRITGWEDRKGTTYAYTYDSEGRCVRTAGSDGFLNGTFDYDTDRRATVHTDSLGHTTTFHYNEDLQITLEINALGHATTSEWNSRDQLVARTDALGRTTRYTRDAEGNLLALHRPDSTTTTAEYNALRLPESITEPDGSRWLFGYDERGNLLTVTDPVEATTRHAYDELGRVTAVTDALGNTRRIEADACGQPSVMVDAGGSSTRYAYDPLGRVTAITDPTGGVTRFTWSVEGLLTSRRTPSGGTERWVYDGEGNLTEHFEPAGAVNRFESTHFDLMTARTAPDGSRMEFGYDTELRLTRVTDQQGSTWSYEYDPAGNLVRETDFNGRVLTYRYDAAGQLVERTNAAGQTVEYTRDALGNITRQSCGGLVTTFRYDLLGRMVQASNADADVHLELDGAGRVLSETCNGRVLGNTYDLLGRRTRRLTPGAAVSTWEYDADHRPTALRAAGQVLSFGYDTTGRETGRHLGTTTLRREWDDDHRLTAQTLTTEDSRLSLSRRYTYRADDYLTGVDDSSGGSRRYDLDQAGRVTAVHADAWTERYAYDTAGNLTEANWPTGQDPEAEDAAVVGTRTFTAALIGRAGRTTFEHDAQGRVVRRSRKQLSGGSRTWEYRWDGEDRLTDAITPDGRHWRYLYDPLGRRIAKQLLDGDGGVLEQTDFTWDGTLLAEQWSSAEDRTLTLDWAPGSGLPVAQTDRVPLSGASQGEFDERFYGIVTDLLGTPTELVSPDGRIGWSLRTSLWGNPLPAPRGETDCPLRFPGQYHDDETGLHYNYFRYYDPTVGRFHSLDPLGLDGGPNPGWYVPNPTAWIDPYGLALCRTKPRIEDGNLKEGWEHIDARHITGDHPKGPGDLMPPDTTRAQVEKAAAKAVRKGRRITENPNKLMQSFEKKMTVNGFTATYRVSVDSTDGNRVISFFPVGKSFEA